MKKTLTNPHPVIPKEKVSQQEWNFSPTGSIIQIEDHEVDLDGVRMLQLIVSPEIKCGAAVATMASWRLA
jgi:hypothetical protein